MKIKTLLIIVITFFLNFQLLSQVTEGKVNYSIDFNRQYEEAPKHIKEAPQSKVFFERLINAGEAITLELRFSGNIAVFKLLKSLSVGKTDATFNLAKSYASNGVYFTDLDKKIQLIQKQQGRQKFNVESPIEPIKWTLTRETKKIGEFECYKAFYKKDILGKERDVIAWYAPSIPFAFGPKEFVGSLPGLILELDDPAGKFRCTYLELSPENKIVIDWPENDNQISSEEYKKQGDKIYKKIKTN